VKPEFDLTVRAITPHTYANLNRVNRLLFDGRLTINHPGWRAAIRNDMQGLAAEERERGEESLQALFAELDPQYRRGSLNLSASAKLADPVLGTKGKTTRKAKRDRKAIFPSRTKTVASVAEWIDTITGSPHYPKTNPAAAAVFQWCKIVHMGIRARKLDALNEEYER
jgi:hypothetical protein